MVVQGSFFGKGFFKLSLCFSSPISKTENLYICMLVIPYFVMGRVMEATTYRKYFRSIKPAMKTVWTLLFCAFMAYVSYLTLEETEFILPHIVMYVMSILYLIVCLFNGRINQRSDYCVEITGKLLGLKEFIKTAEMPRLKELVAENPAYYYEVFPYAMVFGLADKWSKQFTNISVEAPKWYTSYYPHAVFSAVDFNHTFNTEMTKSMAKVAAASHSSGGGGGHGGGHSGGGGGGGGGGGW